MFVVLVSPESAWEPKEHYLAYTASDVCEIVENQLAHDDGTECDVYPINPKGNNKLASCQAFANFELFLSRRRERTKSSSFRNDPKVASRLNGLWEELDELETAELPLPQTILVICEWCDSYAWKPLAYSKYNPRYKPNDADNPAPECPECGSDATVAREWGQ